MATDTPMHTDFAGWYSHVSMGDKEGASRRWPGVAALAEKGTSAEVEVLTRLVLKTRHKPSGAETESIASKIKAEDDTFDSSSATREIQILSAAALAQMSKSSAIGALAISCANFGGSREFEVPIDLPGIAGAAIRKLGHDYRERSDWNQFAIAAADTKYVPAEELAASAMIEGLKKGVNTALSNTAHRTNMIFNKLVRQQKICDEELQMLWWLTNGYSDSGLPFEKVEANSRPLVLAGELEKRTAWAPGPNSSRALLSRAGIKASGKMTIADSVNAVSDHWVNAAVGSRNISPVLLPLHDAIKRRAEAGAGDSWIANWAAVVQVPEAYMMSPLDIANQYYNERLLLRHI